MGAGGGGGGLNRVEEISRSVYGLKDYRAYKPYTL